jgi:hypothetical protein
MRECPRDECGGKLYKEIYEDGMARLHCVKCEWKSALVDRHLLIGVQSVVEKKKDWA